VLFFFSPFFRVQVLSFDYLGRRINLLDTPGHQDFSEDTYRTLAACDNAVSAPMD